MIISEKRIKIREMKNKNDINGLIKALKSDDSDIKYEASRCLQEIGNKEVVIKLIKNLKDKNSPLREVSISILGRIGNKNSLKPLVSALNDNNSKIREEAARALGQLEDKRAVEPLIRTLKDNDKNVRRSAIGSLGIIGDKRAVEPLIQTLDDPSPNMRRDTINALGKLKDEKAIEYLLKMVNDEAKTDEVHIETGKKITVGMFAKWTLIEISPEVYEPYFEQKKIEEQKRIIEFEIKGFSEKEIEAIIDYGYTEHQILEMRNSGKRIETTKLTPQPTAIHIEKVESLESIGGSKISDSIVQRSTVGIEVTLNNCPFCGKKFSFKKTPKFCPYCNEELG